MAAPIRIFVRVGALRRFHLLREKTAELPVVVHWDRRRGDRRASPEHVTADQRRTDRRANPPYTWQVADFVVVEDDEVTAAK